MPHFRPHSLGIPSAETIIRDLDHARGPDAAYYLSHALHSLLDNAKARCTALSVAEAGELVRALDEVTPTAKALFPVYIEGAFAFQALAKAKELVLHWAGGGLCNGTRRNAMAYVTWLRNYCHNLSLLDEIETYHAARARDARQARGQRPAFDVHSSCEGDRRPRISQA
jgi:hypothetical protein